jgi:Flp pilus assembly protein TadD
LTSSVTFVASTWVVFFAIITMLTLVIGYVLYGISPLHSLQRIAHEQKQAAYEHRQNVRETAQAQARKEMGDYYVDLGNSLLNVGRAKEAQAEFDKALEIDPLNGEAQQGTLQADLFISIEEMDYDPGITQQRLSALLEKHPNDTHILAFLGVVWIDVDKDYALEQFEKAVSSNPSNAYAYKGLSTIYYEEGKFDKFLEVSEKAWHAAAWDPTYWHNYASALFSVGHYDDSIASYEALMSWDPSYMWAYHDVAQTYRLTGDLGMSRWRYLQFIDMLETEDIMSLERNQGTFTFTTGPDSDPVWLSENAEMRYYAYYGMALTSYLQGYTEEAESYLSKAQAVPIDPYLESEVKRLMGYDIKLLQEGQEGFRAKADDFRVKYL